MSQEPPINTNAEANLSQLIRRVKGWTVAVRRKGKPPERQRDPEFAKRLSEAMAAAGVKNHHIAKEFPADPGTVSGWVNGEVPGDYNLGRLAKRLGVRFLWLKSAQGQRNEPSRVAEPAAPYGAVSEAEAQQRALAEYRRGYREGYDDGMDRMLSLKVKSTKDAVAILKIWREATGRDAGGDGEDEKRA